MSNTTAGLLALLIVSITAIVLFVLCRLSETGHGSRLKDLDEGLERLREAHSPGERLFIVFYFARLLMRMGQWGFAAAAIAALATMAAGVFGGGWEFARRMLCDVLRFMENVMTGNPKSCEPMTSA